MYQRVKRQQHRTVGASSTLRALQKGHLTEVYLARDTDRRIINPIIALCKTHDVKMTWVDCQHALGVAVGLRVGTTAVGFLREE